MQILAEFGYDGVVMETFPWDQSVPSRLAFHLKKDFFPFVYAPSPALTTDATPFSSWFLRIRCLSRQQTFAFCHGLE